MKGIRVADHFTRFAKKFQAVPSSPKSLDQPVDLLAESREDARFGDADGVARHAERLGHVARAPTFQDQLPEGRPGRRLELRLDQFEEPADDVPVVLLVPQTAQSV
jgi:hypothetical protein